MPHDTLQLGAERLAETMPVMAEAQHFAIKTLVADPGIRALVELAESLTHITAGPLTKESARAALRKWEKGLDTIATVEPSDAT